MRLVRILAVVLPLVLGLGVVAVGVAASMASVSNWGLASLAALFFVFVGLALPRRWRLVSAGGAALFVVVALARLTMVSSTVLVLPGGQPSGLAGLIEERDLSVMVTRWGGPLRVLPRPELPGVHKAMRAAYREMAEAHGLTASPVLDTVLGRNGAQRFDAVVFQGSATPSGAVVFLHGYGGNFTLSCWLVARAAREAGMMTVCPSVGTDGRWWEGEGPATLEATLRWLEGKGIKRIVLGGLSNGAHGASALAPGLEGRLAGLLLISGGLPESRPVSLPVLAIHGRRDTMAKLEQTRRYMAQYGLSPFARLVEVPEGHFALLVRREELGREITRWLQVVTSAPAPRP